MRGKLARKADLCILPQQQRLERFIAETGRQKPTFCVWNCPALDEVARPREGHQNHPVRFYYHGSLNSERLPPMIIDALQRASPTAVLWIAGYETVGSQGYMRELLRRAESLGVRTAFAIGE